MTTDLTRTPAHDVKTMARPFAIAAAVYTALGLLGGLGYRELTRNSEVESFTQLSVLHTHLLVLGTVMMLVFLSVDAILHLPRTRLFSGFFWTYHVGVALTTAMMSIIGIRQLNGSEHSKALAGISGTGHILITAAFIMFFILLFRSLGEQRDTTKN